jgi:two-component system NarL family sensor kinase
LLEDDPERTRSSIQRALQLARDSLQEARRSVLDLRAAPLDGKSLPDALQRLAEQFADEHEIRCAVQIEGFDGRLPARLEAGLYRLVQEALTNVAKHAQADQVTVTLARAGEALSLIIEDDGVGFDPAIPVAAGPSGGFGLAGMRERAALLGGKLLITSRPGQGTRLEIRIPEHAGRLRVAV